jgi:hypothetical protein
VASCLLSWDQDRVDESIQHSDFDPSVARLPVKRLTKGLCPSFSRSLTWAVTARWMLHNDHC